MCRLSRPCRGRERDSSACSAISDRDRPHSSASRPRDRGARVLDRPRRGLRRVSEDADEEIFEDAIWRKEPRGETSGGVRGGFGGPLCEAPRDGGRDGGDRSSALLSFRWLWEKRTSDVRERSGDESDGIFWSSDCVCCRIPGLCVAAGVGESGDGGGGGERAGGLGDRLRIATTRLCCVDGGKRDDDGTGAGGDVAGAADLPRRRRLGSEATSGLLLRPRMRGGPRARREMRMTWSESRVPRTADGFAFRVRLRRRRSTVGGEAGVKASRYSVHG